MTLPDSEAADRDAACALMDVSRETMERLATYVERLLAWQRVKNLVAPSTLDKVWTRHVADSAQLAALAPAARRWVDLGAGAGFPGLVVAILLTGVDNAHVDLIESNGRKCAFLREVARETRAPAVVHAGRIEAVLPGLTGRPDVVTSRALAPLATLVDMSRSLLDCGAMGLFLTGENVGDSLHDMAGSGYAVEAIPSRTHPGARIVRVTVAGAPMPWPVHRRGSAPRPGAS